MLSLLARNRSTLGLDIGSDSVKVAVIDHGGPEPEVSRLGHATLRVDAIVEGEVLDARLVSDTVRGLLAELDLPPLQVVTAVGGRDLIVKKLQLDRMPMEDAREVIRWEAEQYVPFDMENVELDFQILDPTGDGLQMDVLLVAAKRELIDQRMTLLREASMTPVIIDADAFALHNAFEYNHPEAMTGSAVLVNVGSELSTVNVLQDGVPVLTRDLPFGSRHLREELRRMHGLSEEEAHAVVLGRSERQQDFTNLLGEACEELAVGIERAVAFLAIGAPERRPGRAYLCGGGVRIPGLVSTIADRLRVRTEIANPFERLRVRPAAAARFPLEVHSPAMMLAVGLALRTSS